MGTGYFRYEPRRLSYAELARIVRGQGSPLFMWIMKSLGISWHSAWARKYPSSIREWLSAPEEFAPNVLTALAAARAEMYALGFESVAFLGQQGCLYPSESGTELYRHVSGSAKATVAFSKSATLERTIVTISSAFADGRTLYTTNRDELDGPKEHVGKEVFKKSASEVWKVHQERVAAAGSPALEIRDGEAALDFQERSEKETWDSFIKRRVMVECTEDEVARAQRRLEMLRGADGEAPGPNASVMLEMVHILERKQTRQEKLWAFGVTLVLFLLVGFVWWEPKMLWMLAVALIIHECGHYVTMRLFGYRNLRMIFVPLGGAAVIGQNFNVPGWKKAIVSLMGPLPGILIALGLSIAAFFGPASELRFDVALMFLVLNAINLLPVFPLDGGSYLNAILFCRNAKIEVVFKAFAFTVLAISAIALRDFVLGAFAYFLFLGLAISYRLARLTERLRGEIEIPAVNDPNELPAEIKNRVIEGVKEALKKPTSAKTVAAHALGIFERLNARPPGAVGTVVLMLVYAGSFLLVLAATVGFGVGGIRHAASQPAKPNTAWNCGGGAAEVVKRPLAPMLAGITFKKVEDRDAFLSAVEKAFPTNEPFASGLTVFMPYAKEDAKKLVRQIRKQSGSFVVEGGQVYRKRPTVYWSFTAKSEEEAKAIEAEIRGYDNVATMFNAYAPWTPGRLLTAEETHARASLVKLWAMYSEAAVEEADSKPGRDLMTSLVAGLERRTATNSTLDGATVAWFTNYLTATNDQRFLKGAGAEGTKRFGRAPEDESTGAHYLTVEREGPVLRVDMQFSRMEQGFVAFGNWLCARGCLEILYTFRME